MNTNLSCISAASLVLLTIVTPPAEAQTRCGRPLLTPVETVACAKGRENIDELRRYVWRTRMIHNLHLPQYVLPQAAPLIAQAPARDVPKSERNDVARGSR